VKRRKFRDAGRPGNEEVNGSHSTVSSSRCGHRRQLSSVRAGVVGAKGQCIEYGLGALAAISALSPIIRVSRGVMVSGQHRHGEGTHRDRRGAQPSR
jgi:hypothetical protein